VSAQAARDSGTRVRGAGDEIAASVRTDDALELLLQALGTLALEGCHRCAGAVGADVRRSRPRQQEPFREPEPPGLPPRRRHPRPPTSRLAPGPAPHCSGGPPAGARPLAAPIVTHAHDTPVRRVRSPGWSPSPHG